MTGETSQLYSLVRYIFPPLEADDGSQSEHNCANDEQVGEDDGANQETSSELEAEDEKSDALRNGGGTPVVEESDSDADKQTDQ